MRKKLEKMLTAKQEQRDNLNAAIIEAESKEERAAMGETLNKLSEEIEELRGLIEEVDEPAENNDPAEDRQMTVIGSTIETRTATATETDKTKAEARAQAFAASGKMTITNEESRAVLVSSGKIAAPTEVGGIVDQFSPVSSIVDQVKVVDASGMGAYKVAYQKATGTASAQTEGLAIANSDPEFDFVEITPETIAILAYISNQVQKQSPLNYEAKVREAALAALRVKVGEKIVTAIKGSNIKQAETLEAVDDTTLRKIALKYGGDETVQGGTVLYLNKNTLVKLGDVRNTNKKAVYEITPDAANPNTGVIQDGGLAVKYCLNSKLADDEFLYGQPHAVELALFGDYSVKVSEDFAFDKNMLTIRGTADVGAGLVKLNGFIYAKVGA